MWNIWEFLIILFDSFLFFLFMNRKLDSKKRISKWQWCAWLLFSIILFFLNQMKVSIFYTVFYGIIVHFLITMIYSKIIYVFLTIFLYLLKCPQSLIL